MQVPSHTPDSHTPHTPDRHPSDSHARAPAAADEAEPKPVDRPRRARRRRAGVLAGAALVLLGAAYVFSYLHRPEQIYQRALKAVARDDFKQAQRELRRLQAFRECEPQASLIAGILALHEQKLDAALNELRFAVDDPETRVLARTLMGRTMYQQHRFHEAEQNLLAALEFDPGQAEAHRWLGIANYDVGAMLQADLHLRQAAELATQDPVPHRILGLIHNDLEDLEKAVDDYQESLRRDAAFPGRLKPTDRQAMYIELAGAQVGLVRWRDALATLRQADESADVLALRAECHAALGEADRVQECLERALALDPGHLKSLLAKARLALDSNEPEAALVPLERAVEKHPRDAPLHYVLSQAHQRLGHTDLAQDHVREFEALQQLAQQLADLKRRAIEQPRDAAVCYQLGLLNERLGLPDAAGNWYAATLSLDARHQGAQERLREMAPKPATTEEKP
ncbi:MAG TPA: hypothetical protein VMV69_01400 [Pirellulales bacterium]|nr:hypothetical protein [Pirellulales bacterium]